MRPNRLKPDDQDTWHHCFNRVAGYREDRPLDTRAKRAFFGILVKLLRLYVIEVVEFCFMDNHYHLLLRVPAAGPSEEETIRRYEAYHKGRLRLRPGSKEARHWQQRLRDLSGFMRHFQQNCAIWYNNNQPELRRGSLWGSRFKNTVLESGDSVVQCYAYIVENPVSAGMVTHAGAYAHSGFGRYWAGGRHPFGEQLTRLLLPMLGLARLDELAAKLIPPETKAEEEQPAAVLQRRVNHWIDGLIIGSETFVRRLAVRVTNPARAHERKLTEVADTGTTPLVAWRHPLTS